VERIARARPQVVGTVGRIEARPGAINVIPGEVQFSVDLRAPQDPARQDAVAAVRTEVALISESRGVGFEIETLQELGSSGCAPWLMAQLERAVEREGVRVLRLPSGAGHDGMALKALADIAMLFVRCQGGISHNPAEAISEQDAAIGARVLYRFIHDFRPDLSA
jgi:allantoate deiminase